jgi:hypothetical protein
MTVVTRVGLQAAVCTCIGVMVAGCSSETPVWTSEPVPLLQAIAENNPAVVIEWAEGGADLNRPLPLAGVGAEARGSWADTDTVSPLELAIALRRTSLALLLVTRGAVVGRSGEALLCQVVSAGSPADVDVLVSHGTRVDPTGFCEAEADTIVALAQQNSPAMASTIAALTARASD